MGKMNQKIFSSIQSQLRLWDFDPVLNPNAHCEDLLHWVEACERRKTQYKMLGDQPCKKQNCFLKKLKKQTSGLHGAERGHFQKVPLGS